MNFMNNDIVNDRGYMEITEDKSERKVKIRSFTFLSH